MRHIVLFSGGPDSLATLFKVSSLVECCEAIYFDLGHRYSNLEKQVCSSIVVRGKKVIISDVLKGLGEWEEDDAYIWHRNAFLCLAASKYIGAEKGNIYLTVQKDELSVSDRTPEFMFQMSKLFKSLGQSIDISSPWLHTDKTDMIKETVSICKTVFPSIKEAFKDTWSCYRPVEVINRDLSTEAALGSSLKAYLSYVQCGKCPACFRRWVAFSLNGIEEKYLFDPWLTDVAIEYRRKAEQGEYSDERCHRILSALSAKE